MSLTLLAEAVEPGLQIALGPGGSTPVKLLLLFTALGFASAIVISITSFTRIIVVLAFLRQALGAGQTPPNQVLLSLALALTAFVMAPTATRVQAEALGPYLDGTIDASTAFDRGSQPVREFLLRQTHEADLRLFYEVSGRERPSRADDIPLTIAVPAFLVSELTTSFRMGLAVLVPMLIIDLLVASVLVSLGLVMLPPNLVSLPLKLGVFLLADGWHLVVGSLVRELLMPPSVPIALVREGLVVGATVAGPLFAVLVVIGLVVGIAQAATQVNDPAVSSLPRLAAAALTCWLLGGWMLEQLAAFLRHALLHLAGG